MAFPAPNGLSSRARQFDSDVLAAVERAERDWELDLKHIEVAVEDVPPSDPSAWEDSVALGRAFPAQGSLNARMVIYRLPVSTRTPQRLERLALIEHVVRTQLSVLTGHPYNEHPFDDDF